MSRKHSRRSTAATDRGRRSFLVKSVAGGVSAPLVLCGAEPARAAGDAPCDFQATPLEALISLKDILSGLQGAVYRQSTNDLGVAVERTTNYFAELCDKVRQLKGELVKARKGTEYERMQAMADVGCAGAGQLENLSDAGKVQAQLASLNVIGEQIRKMAHELLPEGQGVTLSAEAARVLREIIILVDEQTVAARRQLLTALASSRRAANEFETSIQRVQSLLSAAIEKMYERDSAERADLLIALTDGTRQWVADERAVSADAGGTTVFRKAAYLREPAGPAYALGSGEVYNLLAQFYPPENLYKAGKCLFLLTQLKFWTKPRNASREEVMDLVRRALNSYSITCREYRGRACQPDRFVQELANIILR
jgi:hypothetical protein